jgi:nickel/cobalt exporter
MGLAARALMGCWRGNAAMLGARLEKNMSSLPERDVARARRAVMGLAAWALTMVVLGPASASAHPLGNFSISHYAGIRVEADVIEIRYVIDMAEIPTFQEIQDTGIVPEPAHPGVRAYLARKAETLAQGLRVELNGRPLPVEVLGTDIIFPEGAGGLPTLKMGIRYRARVEAEVSPTLRSLHYRDTNYPDRAGWKEIVATAGPRVRLLESTASEQDRSGELSDYPTDLLDSPPQQVEARMAFAWEPAVGAAPAPAAGGPGRRAPARAPSAPPTRAPRPALTASVPAPAAVSPGDALPPAALATSPEPIALRPNVQATPRNSFTELLVRKELSLGVVLAALVVAAGLGAFHALEPGHGKTVVAAYLVGARGTARHAAALGLIVTASHTAGVYLLGAVTLYATRYVVPERLYPWLGAISGLTITGLGVYLLVTRWRGPGHARHHHHGDDHSHDHDHAAAPSGHDHTHGHSHGAHHHHHDAAHDTVSTRQLLALGITGGIVPCPAALVVLLSAISLGRVGFGLLLIVAFSLGLAAVLMGIGLLVVHARTFMRRFQGEGPMITRWLPITSAVVITLVGVAIVIQALMPTGAFSARMTSAPSALSIEKSSGPSPA